jgi:hypothetical protein
MKNTVFQKIIASAGLMGIVVLLTGCPYSSSVPIDEGSVKVSNELVGQWIKSSDKETENPTYFVIAKDDKTHATARKFEYSSSDTKYDTTTYHLTFSDVTGDVFMNAIEDGGASYSLYKFIMDEKTKEVTTYEVTDYIKETFNSSKELKDFISKNKSMSYFFTNTTETYVKK